MASRIVLAFCTTAALATTSAAVRAANDAVGFIRDVKPLLARRCFSRHGPTAQEGGLRLDKPEAALAELDSGRRAIVPGHIEQSALVARVSAADESERMPPEGKPLTPQEIGALKQWIASGAKWEKHWAFVPPQRHTPPSVSRQAWVQNPIDAFILAPLEQAGLEPSPSADKRTLARRADFGVTGLPPTNEQIELFLMPSPMHGRGLPMRSSHRHITANTGRDTGSTSYGLPKPIALSGTVSSPMRGNIATT